MEGGRERRERKERGGYSVCYIEKICVGLDLRVPKHSPKVHLLLTVRAGLFLAHNAPPTNTELVEADM